MEQSYSWTVVTQLVESQFHGPIFLFFVETFHVIGIIK